MDKAALAFASAYVPDPEIIPLALSYVIPEPAVIEALDLAFVK